MSIITVVILIFIILFVIGVVKEIVDRNKNGITYENYQESDTSNEYEEVYKKHERIKERMLNDAINNPDKMTQFLNNNESLFPRQSVDEKCSASELMLSYRKNEKRFNDNYEGKNIIIDDVCVGGVNFFDFGKEAIIYLTDIMPLENSFKINFSFGTKNDLKAQEIRQIKVGDRLLIVGRVSGIHDEAGFRIYGNDIVSINGKVTNSSVDVLKTWLYIDDFNEDIEEQLEGIDEEAIDLDGMTYWWEKGHIKVLFDENK